MRRAKILNKRTRPSTRVPKRGRPCPRRRLLRQRQLFEREHLSDGLALAALHEGGVQKQQARRELWGELRGRGVRNR